MIIDQQQTSRDSSAKPSKLERTLAGSASTTHPVGYGSTTTTVGTPAPPTASSSTGGGGGGGSTTTTTTTSIPQQQLFAEGPTKFAKLTASITAFSIRIRAAQEELEKASVFTKDLETQCSIQERQCVQLEEEQRAVSDEVGGLVGKIEGMLAERVKIEAKYEELKAENAKLDALIKADEAAFAASVGTSYS